MMNSSASAAAPDHPAGAADESTASSSQEGSSQRSSSSNGGTLSLLERIQLQREREAALAAAAEAQQQQTPQHIQVPSYGEPTGTGGGVAYSGGVDSTNNFFSTAWNNISQSMETVMAEHNDMEEALLMAPTSGTTATDGDEHYSMQNYFMTFVRDIYGLFLRLPVPARFVSVIGLLYIAWKLL